MSTHPIHSETTIATACDTSPALTGPLGNIQQSLSMSRRLTRLALADA